MAEAYKAFPIARTSSKNCGLRIVDCGLNDNQIRNPQLIVSLWCIPCRILGYILSVRQENGDIPIFQLSMPGETNSTAG